MPTTTKPARSVRDTIELAELLISHGHSASVATVGVLATLDIIRMQSDRAVDPRQQISLVTPIERLFNLVYEAGQRCSAKPPPTTT